MDWAKKLSFMFERNNSIDPLENYRGDPGRERIIGILLSNLAIGGDQEIANLIFNNGELRHFEKGETVIKEGDDDNDVYFLISGEVDVITKRQKMAIRRSPTQVGEMSAISPGQKRTALIKVRSNGLVAIRMSGFEYHRIWSDNSGLSQRLQVELAARSEERINAGKVLKENSALLWTCMSFVLGILISFCCFIGLQGLKIDPVFVWSGSVGAFLLVFIFFQLLNPAYTYRRLVALLAGGLITKFLFDFSGSIEIISDFGNFSAKSDVAEMGGYDIFNSILISLIMLIALIVCACRDRHISS